MKVSHKSAVAPRAASGGGVWLDMCAGKLPVGRSADDFDADTDRTARGSPSRDPIARSMLFAAAAEPQPPRVL